MIFADNCGELPGRWKAVTAQLLTFAPTTAEREQAYDGYGDQWRPFQQEAAQRRWDARARTQEVLQPGKAQTVTVQGDAEAALRTSRQELRSFHKQALS